jgi:hypothetical protein
MTATPVNDALLALFAEVRRELDGLIRLLGDDAARDALFSDLGLAPGLPISGPVLAAQGKLLKGADPELQEMASTIQSVVEIVGAIEDIAMAASAADPATAVDDILGGIFRIYASRTLRFRAPAVWAVFQLLGFIVSEDLVVENIAKFIGDTGAYMAGRSGASSGEEVIDNYSLILGVIGIAVLFAPTKITELLGSEVLFGWDPDPTSTTPNADAVLMRALTIQFKFKQELTDNIHTTQGLTLTSILVPAEHHNGEAGYFGALGGRASIAIDLGQGWDLKFELAGADALEFFIGEHPVVRVPVGQNGTTPAQISLTVTLERPDDSAGAWNIGPANKTHLAIGKAAVGGTIGTASSGVLLSTKDTALVIAAGDGDGFLQKVLPSGGIQLEADIGLGVDSKRGFYIDGGTKLEATIPINKAVFGLEIQQITVGVLASGGNGAASFGLELAGSFGLSIGGVLSASVDQIGTQLVLDVPADGKATLKPRFSPPKGLGIAVNATIVKGGGYLFFDPEKGEYGGVGELKIGPVDVKAIILLSTKLPDGSAGFSILFIITIEFDPALNIGFGFTLNGVGGLIGIHHAVATDQLQAGLKNHSLDNILFPSDPVASAPRILATMRSVFPINPERYVFGPLLRLGWGTPVSLITLTIGVILDVPAPIRLVILGQLKMALPTDDVSLILLKADILGVIDFDQGTVTVDVSLTDSRVTVFAISGDLTVRIKVGSGGYFIFSAGGFHPKYKPVPAGLGGMRRLAIDISGSPNPKLRLEAYLALTSNSFQIGARLELYAGAGPFSVEGYLGFDALVIWDPKFYFSVEIGAGIALKYDGDSLFGITLDLLLEGPSPWHAKGTATFSILFWDVSFDVEATWGDDDAQAPPPSIDATATVTAALSDAGNWSGALPADGDRLVTLLSRETPGVLVHPLGQLVVKQTVAPLGLHLDRIGNSRVSGTAIVSLGTPTFAKAGGGSIPASASTPVTESFAPGQFLDLSQDDKLTRPAFETMQAGLTIAAAGVLFGTATETDTKYETVIVHQQQSRRGLLFHMPLGLATAMAAHGATARAAVRADTRYAAVGNQVSVDSGDLVIVASRHDLTENSSVLATATTFSIATQALASFAEANPDQAGRYQLVGPHEALKP